MNTFCTTQFEFFYEMVLYLFLTFKDWNVPLSLSFRIWLLSDHCFSEVFYEINFVTHEQVKFPNQGVVYLPCWCF